MDEFDIIDFFWDALDPGETEDASWVDRSRWELLYDHGFVEARRLPKARWMELLKKLPHEEGRYRLMEGDLPKFAPFLYHGPIKKPFDPLRLKDGIRPQAWLIEMYQKVLKFETTLKPAEWSQLIQQEIKPRFQVKEEFRFDKRFKEWLVELLDKKASPLRRLETWVHVISPLERAPVPPPAPETRPSSEPIPDRFVAEGPEGKKIQKIEKLYYQEHPSQPISDQEVLNFLEELEGLEEDEENPLKDQ